MEFLLHDLVDGMFIEELLVDVAHDQVLLFCQSLVLVATLRIWEALELGHAHFAEFFDFAHALLLELLEAFVFELL